MPKPSKRRHHHHTFQPGEAVQFVGVFTVEKVSNRPTGPWVKLVGLDGWFPKQNFKRVME